MFTRCILARLAARRSGIAVLPAIGLAATLLIQPPANGMAAAASTSAAANALLCGQPVGATAIVAETSALTNTSMASLWRSADERLAQGRFGEAERILRTAAPSATDDASRGGTALRLGVVLTACGQLAAAKDRLDEASGLEAKLSADDQLLLPQALGTHAVRDGQLGDAEAHFDRATEMADTRGARDIEARARANALRARMDAGRIGALEDRLAELDALVSGLPPGESTAVLLIANGELHRQAVKEFRSPSALTKAALESLERARSMAESDATRSFAVGYLGALYEDAGRLDEARTMTARAVFLAQAAGDRDALYFWEWQEARIERARKALPAAAAAIDRSVASLSPIQTDLLQRTPGAFQDVIEPVYLEYADVNLRVASTMTDGSDPHQAVLRSVRNRLESLKFAEIRDYFADECVAVETDDIDRFDVPGAAVVYPVVLSDRTEVLLESGGVLKSFSVEVPRGRVIATARRLRVALERAGSGDTYLEPSQQLYSWLLADARPWLKSNGVDTLVFVPSGALRTIPLGALHDGRQYLVESFAVATTPAVSLVTSPDTRTAERLFIGGLTEEVEGFRRLDNVPREIQRVSDIFPPAMPPLDGPNFRREAVSSQLSAGGFSVAHLATHGEFRADHRQSFIVTVDGELTMDGLQSALRQRGDDSLNLLVLSACETAAGDDRAALGLAGVAVQSGADSAVASLWFISDAATADLMDRFYTNLNAGSTMAQSLQAAQLELMKSPRYQHPSYWAPYLLIGNWL